MFTIPSPQGPEAAPLTARITLKRKHRCELLMVYPTHSFVDAIERPQLDLYIFR